MATVEMDTTSIESHEREAEPHYKGGRGDQPAIPYWAQEWALGVAYQY